MYRASIESTEPAWWARGLLFENCNCQLLCPGHLSFKQLCTHDRCLGAWAMHLDEGRHGDVSLAGLNAVVLFDAPQRMIAGGWTTALFIDDRCEDRQRAALERILSGAAGGPWAVLARFVARRLESRSVPVHFEDGGRRKRMWVSGALETSIEAIRGRDASQEAVLSNVFNQIHAPLQALALGQTRCFDPRMTFDTSGTHALYSRFSWEVA
jgi:hypothetical protein